MQSVSSAKRTCSASASAVECTATVRMPISRQARITRSAISPRLAINTFLNTKGPLSERRQPDQPLPVLHVLPVLGQDLHDLAVGLGFDLVHQLHGLDDAHDLTLLHGLSDLDEGVGVGR